MDKWTLGNEKCCQPLSFVLCTVTSNTFIFQKKSHHPTISCSCVIKWNCLTFCSCCFNIGLNKKICSQSPRAAWRWVTCDQIFERNKSFFNENNGKGFKMLKHWRFKNPAIRCPKSFNYVARTWNWLFCRSGLLVPMYLSEEEGDNGKTIPTVARSLWQFLPFSTK